MAHEQSVALHEDAIRLDDLAPRLVGLGLLLAVIGWSVGLYLGLRDRAVFFHAYLVAFVFFLSMTLGAIFFMVLHHLARAGWSVTVRRLAEGLAGNIYLMLMLFIPLLFGLEYLYHWSHPGVAAHDPVLSGKAGYLSVRWFVIRMGLCFVIWIFLTWFFRGRSIRQDATGDLALSRIMEKVSAPGMMLLGFSLTFAAFDLLMSLNPHWFSTIFGVYYFAGCALSFLVVLTLLALWLQRAGRLRDAITTEHYHDLGKLTFAFTFFWGYIAFSQYMLIWYANMPEETQFFIPRQLGPWATLSLILLVCHLLIPFAGLLSRHAKRGLGIFTFWAVWLLLAHLLDMFWIVMPNLLIGQVPEAVRKVTGETGLSLNEALQRMTSNQNIYQLNQNFADFSPVVAYPLTATPIIVTVSLVIGMGGLYLVSTALMLRGSALVPLKDPRLPESLAFENA